jgi:catalase
MTLDRNPENYFEDVEQSAFDPGHFVDGVGASPDRMLQARLFAYGDAHRYRLGIHHTHLPVNQPKGVQAGARTYGRDGLMARGGGSSANYFPNSRGGPAPIGRSLVGESVHGRADRYAPVLHSEDNDYVQAGALYRVMKDDERARLIENLAGSLALVSLPGVVERAVNHFEQADAELGTRVRERVIARKR